MTLRYSFSSVWKIAVAVICTALFVMSAVGFVFAQRMHHEFKHEIANHIDLLGLATDIVYEISETSAEFGRLLVYQGESTDISACIFHLDQLRKRLNDPLLTDTGQLEFHEVVRKSELRLRTMLYAYQKTNFSDPARDRAQESLKMIVEVIRDARAAALTQCRKIQRDINVQTEELIKLTERARMYLYIALTAGLISVLLMVYVIGRELRYRLQYIICATDHVRNGDLTYRIDMPFKDEIGSVADRFNVMAEEIEKKESELCNSNQILSDALEEAHHASMLKSEFLANVSHELRTPMNAIIGFTGMVLEDTISDDHRRYLNMVQDASANLMEIIDNLLNLAKIESGQLSVEKQYSSIHSILHHIEVLMGPQAKKKNIQFEIHSCKELPSVVQTDPMRVQQCLVNLVSNAIKFTFAGHVYLNVSLEKRHEKDWVRFDVEDTGVGIPQDKWDVIFEPFRQADGSSSRRFGGTGLGLSITRKLIELMGGSISVQSTVDVGSVFTLVLPVMPLGGVVPMETTSKKESETNTDMESSSDVTYL